MATDRPHVVLREVEVDDGPRPREQEEDEQPERQARLSPSHDEPGERGERRG